MGSRTYSLSQYLVRRRGTDQRRGSLQVPDGSLRTGRQGIIPLRVQPRRPHGSGAGRDAAQVRLAHKGKQQPRTLRYQNLHATKIYKEEENGVAAGFKGSFSRECKPYFIGVWAEGASWSAAAPAELGLQSAETPSYEATSNHGPWAICFWPARWRSQGLVGHCGLGRTEIL